MKGYSGMLTKEEIDFILMNRMKKVLHSYKEDYLEDKSLQAYYKEFKKYIEDDLDNVITTISEEMPPLGQFDEYYLKIVDKIISEDLENIILKYMEE